LLNVLVFPKERRAWAASIDMIVEIIVGFESLVKDLLFLVNFFSVV